MEHSPKQTGDADPEVAAVLSRRSYDYVLDEDRRAADNDDLPDSPPQERSPAPDVPELADPPPRPEDGEGEKRIVVTLAKEQLREGATWYALSARWWRLWRDYSGYERFSYTSYSMRFSSFDVQRPPPINNDDIVEIEQPVGKVTRGEETKSAAAPASTQTAEPPSDERGEDAPLATGVAVAEPMAQIAAEQAQADQRVALKSGLLENSDYELVPGRVWRALKEWYGGGPEIPLSVLRGTTYHKELFVETRRLTVTIYRGSAKGDSVEGRFSKTQTLADVKAYALERFGIEDAASVRLWDFHGKSYYKLLETLSLSLEAAQVVDRNPILLEEKLADGMWPKPPASSSSSSAQWSSNSSGNNSSWATTSWERPSSTGWSSGSGSSYSYGSYSYSAPPMESPGLCGLSNLGNTCFMNSALQCLVNTAPLTEYLLGANWKNDLNRRNPLGTGGELACEYQRLTESIWRGTAASFAPREFKSKLERFAPQFAGYQQHDSHELLSYLLDGLHEDLNRVRDKPYVEMPNYSGEPDDIWARASWARHLLRNDSFIVDTFQGQLRSRLVCPQCGYISVTFDPFMYLSVPLPQATTRSASAIIHRSDPASLPIKVTARVPTTGTVADICSALIRSAGIIEPAPGCEMVATDVMGGRFYKRFRDNEAADEIDDRTALHIYEVPRCAPGCTESESVHVTVTQARKETSNSYYSSTWETQFGTPLILCLPASCTLNQLLLQIARHLRSLLVRTELDRFVAEASCFADVDEAPSKTSRFDDVDSDSDDLNDKQADEGHEMMDVVPNTPEDHAPQASLKDPLMESILATAAPVSPALASIQGMEPVFEDITNADLLRALKVMWTVATADSFGKASFADKLVPGPTGDAPLHLKELHSLAVSWSSAAYAAFKTQEQYEAPKTTLPSAGDEDEEDTSCVTLERCMKLFEQEERLGQDDAWFCPRCKEMRLATKKFDIWKAPGVLVVHLKRFSMRNKYFRDKLDTEVVFPINGLDISSRVLCPHDQPLVYDLFAVSNHYGSLGGGHYTAFAKNKDSGKWHRFDDSHVSKVSTPETEVCTSAAYVLFYQLRGFVAPEPASQPPSAATTPMPVAPAQPEAPGVPRGGVNGESSSDSDDDMTPPPSSAAYNRLDEADAVDGGPSVD